MPSQKIGVFLAAQAGVGDDRAHVRFRVDQVGAEGTLAAEQWVAFGLDLQDNGLFFSFPYVCPEPVLVK